MCDKIDCPICLEEILSDYVTLEECNHKFCKNCFIDWDKHNNSCPLCRHDVVYNFQIKRTNFMKRKYILNFSNTHINIYSIKSNKNNKKKQSNFNDCYIDNTITRKKIVKSFHMLELTKTTFIESKNKYGYKIGFYNNNNNIYEFYVEDDYNFILTKLKVYMTSIRNNISTISSPPIDNNSTSAVVTDTYTNTMSITINESSTDSEYYTIIHNYRNRPDDYYLYEPTSIWD